MKALNRKEVLVNAKANGTLDSFKPLTRDEAFTKKALGLGGGGSGGGGEGVWVKVYFDQVAKKMVADLSFKEIAEKVNAGCVVSCIAGPETQAPDMDNPFEVVPMSKVTYYNGEISQIDFRQHGPGGAYITITNRDVNYFILVHKVENGAVSVDIVNPLG